MTARAVGGVSRWVASLSLALALALARATNADAAPAPASLSWTRLPGAEACIDAPGLARAVEAKIGDVLVTPARAARSVEGRIAPRRGGGWRAVIAVAGSDGRITSQRTLETASADCRVLDAAAALVIALLVDPDRTGATTTAPPGNPEVVIREVLVPIVVREPWQLAASLRADVERGVLASAATIATLGVSLAAPRAPRVELAASYARPHDAATGLPGRAVEQGFVGVAVAVCPRIPVPHVQTLACGGLRVGRLAWSGTGFEQNLDGAAVVPAVTADVRGLIGLGGPLSIVAGLGVRVALRDVVLHYQQPMLDGTSERELARTDRVALWLGIGIELAL